MHFFRHTPYGKECAEVLKVSAELFENNGFKTNVNTEYGYALSYFGNEDAKDIGVFSHGDVVPVGDDWIKCKPFEPIVENGSVFGRGCNDDKSGIITALYVAKAIKELIDKFDFKNVEILDGRGVTTMYGNKGGVIVSF